jgi:UDP-N-acetylglucosamine 4-epimerase
VVFGDGGQTRDFTYVANVVEANILAATAATEVANGTVVNIGAGQRTSLVELLDMLQAVTGRKVARSSQPGRTGDVRDSMASLDRAQRVIGYRPQVLLKEGLQRTWEWFTATDRAAAVLPRTAATVTA